MHRFSWKPAVLGLALLAGCHPGFQLKQFTTNESLFLASKRQFDRKKWDDAVVGFEKLTLDLAPRDTLGPISFWYLGVAHQRQHEFLLASQTFNRLHESFPDDSLAPWALFEEGHSYQSLWTRPDRDASYGDAALSTYTSLSTYYPNSKADSNSKIEIKSLEEMFAQKNYQTGMYYFRDKGYDSAMIYFKQVLENWPDAPTARDAGLRLLESYRAIGYADDAAEACASLRARYPNDAPVSKACPPGATPAPAKPPTVPAKPPAARDHAAAH